jgi:transcriptional regulator with XRE-family HTH domain
MAGNAFGVWLERQLRSRELTQSEFARRTEVRQGMVSNWITGKRIPDPGSCDRIADALGLPIDEVLIQAGHRPRLGEGWEGEEGELMTLFRKLSKVDQYYVLDFARFRWERAQQRRGE